jgi:hypothetical protein
MSRAWPFEDAPEETQVVRYPEDFVRVASGATDAVVIRIGLRDAQLVLVDGDGMWRRWVYPTVEEAQAAAGRLGVPVHVGGYPEPVRLRMNRHRRSAQEFERSAYPEQGEVGPVIPYRENRPPRMYQPPKAEGGSDRA